MPQEFANWVDEYEWAYQHPDTVPARNCPSCGVQKLQLVFVVDEMDSESGRAVFWCDSCLRGLAPNRALLPPSGNRVLKGKERIPNFRLVMESTDQ